MTRYFLLSGSIFGLVCLVAIWRQRRVRASLWRLLLVEIILVILTIIFDNLLIYLKFYSYNSQHISGMMIGKMPIEDLAYALAAGLLPLFWEGRHDD